MIEVVGMGFGMFFLFLTVAYLIGVERMATRRQMIQSQVEMN